MNANPRIILVTGVSGSGKTTIGKALARALGWEFHDADDFHPSANIEKMRSGIPLDDSDRNPWLAAIRAHMDACESNEWPAIYACSALKEGYREQLCNGLDAVGLVFLSGDLETIRARLESRSGHYMGSGMLESQFAALEPPAHALSIDIRLSESEIVRLIRAHFKI